MNVLKKLTTVVLIFFISHCTYIDKEISKSQEEEKRILEQYLGKKSSLVKDKLGEPSQIIFESPYKIYVYKKSQMIITCERRFYIELKKDLIEKFDSKNCLNK
tara:strand:+ start:98 stop:406 length:309 start_codon:yes stop_codon:yes gene_type:complete